MSLQESCRRVKLILSDVDGVMTDGGVTFTATGDEVKTFNIRDGLGIRLWQEAGGAFGVVTGRDSPVVAQRCRELRVEIVHQGVGDKLPVVEQIAAERGLALSQIAYIGDDLPDLPVVRAVGLGVAVADAAAEVRGVARYVTSLAGGRGAVRELVEVVLQNVGGWEQAVARFGLTAPIP